MSDNGIGSEDGIGSDDRISAACLVGTQDLAEAAADSFHPTRVCVIDLGTNSFHTLIVDAYPNGGFEVLDRIKEMVRLGERGLMEHRLTDGGMRRALKAVKRVRLLAEGWGVTEYLAYATSAIREAENGGDLIELIREETGIHVRPISGELEAQLIYEGVRRAVDLRVPTLVVDIGGGSTEFVVGTSDEVFFQTSMKIGAARMTKQFVSTDPVDAKEFRALRRFYREALAPVFEAARAHGVREIVGSSGTMENLAAVYLDRHGDPSRSIYLQPFEPASFRQVTKAVMESTLAERQEMAGIDAKRVRQVVAGAVLVDVLLKDLEIERLRISPNALREGMVVHFIHENHPLLQVRAPYADVRRRAVSEIGHRFGWDQKHVRHVTAMALQLFDACRPLHGLGSDARDLLEYASLLHDVGYYISRTGHHKHSLYLIKQADWRGFQPEEIDVMANVARYHRRSLPRDRHPAYKRLAKPHQKLVDQLAAFLRLANGLDRSHFQNVAALRAELTDKALAIEITTKGDPQLDVWGGRRGADLFRQTFGRDVVITAVSPNGKAAPPLAPPSAPESALESAPEAAALEGARQP